MAEFRLETGRLIVREWRDGEFDHPNVDPESDLLPHVTYCLEPAS
jgi:hypothetical protein